VTNTGVTVPPTGAAMAGVRACGEMLGGYTEGNFGRRVGFSGG